MEDINVNNKPCEIINSTQELAPNDDVVQVVRVLAVDADVYSLQYLCTVLHNCNYRVETTSSAAGALKILSANKHGFDVILVDVDSAKLNGIKLLETIGLEKDLPVIMVTGDDKLENLTKGLLYGAVDYILKPVGIQEIKNAVHGVALTKMKVPKPSNSELAQIIKVELDDETSNIQSDVALAELKKPLKHSKSDYKARIKVEEDETETIRATCVRSRRQQQHCRKNKPRFKWTPELDAMFVSVVQDMEKSHRRVSPKEIAEIMKVDGLSRNVAGSHLQKYRMFAKKGKLADQTAQLKPTSSITSTKRIKWEKDNYITAVPSNFNTAMSTQRTVPYGLDHDEPNIQNLSSEYDNYCLDMNMQPPYNVGSEPIVPMMTSCSPQFRGECSNPSHLNSVPITPSGWNECFAPIPNHVSGGFPNNISDEYWGTTVFARNGEANNGTMESSITELGTHNIINLVDEDDDMITELLDMNFGEGSFNFVSLLSDDDQL